MGAPSFHSLAKAPTCSLGIPVAPLCLEWVKNLPGVRVLPCFFSKLLWMAGKQSSEREGQVWKGRPRQGPGGLPVHRSLGPRIPGGKMADRALGGSSSSTNAYQRLKGIWNRKKSTFCPTGPSSARSQYWL